MLTVLYFDPRRYSAISLHDTIEQEFLSWNEGVSFIVMGDERFPSALDRIEETGLSSFLNAP
jgi:hypothetical protein